MLVCFGTRPEYIKVKSLINNLHDVKTCFTGQHKDLLKHVNVDYNLNMDEIISENRLNNIICNILRYTHIFKDIEYVLVQGDTTSALAMAISAFNNGIKVIHLEAGLRTNNITDPYPEEANRQLISRIASIHLCPTEFNKENLLKESVKGAIYVTGNTGLDNISKEGCEYTNKVLITLHRRDNHELMEKWFQKIEILANKYEDIEFLIPLHPNPNVQKHRGIFNKVKVVESMAHEELIEYVKKCKFVISDSGGLQEECSYLNKKIIVCRQTTERPESVGIHSFICEEPDKLEKMVDEIMNNYEVNAECPYGNGKSWKNVIDRNKLTKKQLILTDERTGGTSMLYILNSFASNQYTGLDDIHTHFYTLKKDKKHWINDIIKNTGSNFTISSYLNNYSRKEELDYFDMIETLFNNGINTYKLSINSISEYQLTTLLQKLIYSKNIEIILLNRKNIFDKILSKCYSEEYSMQLKNYQGYDVVNTKTPLIISKENLYKIIANHKIFQRKYDNIKKSLPLFNEIIYEEFYFDKFYCLNILKKLTNKLNVKNINLFIETYFKNYNKENKIILNNNECIQIIKNELKMMD